MYFFIFILFQIEIPVNSVDPDQTLCSAASDLGLHCLLRSPKRVNKASGRKKVRLLMVVRC